MRKRLRLTLDVTIGESRTHFGTLEKAITAAHSAALLALDQEGLNVRQAQASADWSYVWHEASQTLEVSEAEDFDLALVPAP